MLVSKPAFVCSHRRTFLVALSLASMITGYTDSRVALGQVVLRADAERVANSVPAGDALVTHSDRDYEYNQIQQEASIVERQTNLVRRIVRFSMPTVVHIEASKKADSGPGLASSRVDEAGACAYQPPRSSSSRNLRHTLGAS
jgi:hypothetical protein